MTQTSNNIWQIQADTKGRSDFDFFITPDEKYSVYFSSIGEYGMMKFVSPVQVWTEKENPRLLFQSQKIQFEYQYGESCYYFDKSNILVLLTPCFHQKYYELFYVLFDFSRSIFTTINAPNFLLKEIDRNLIRLELRFRYSYDDKTKEKISQDNGKEIDLTKIIWHDLKNIDNTCSLATKNNR
jgi:hypothetical protein